MLSKSRTGALAGLAAALSMAATPAEAAELPKAEPLGSSIFTDFDQSAYDGEYEVTEHRRFRRRGFRRGFRRHRGIGAGDVLAGVLIIGGIAAIANAATRERRRDRDVVIVDRRDRDFDRRDRRFDRRSTAGSGIDNAVDQCVARIERDVRVDTIDGVDRNAEGWIVTGVLFNGEAFVCEIDNDGRVSDIDFGGLGAGFSGTSFDADAEPVRARGDDAQWTDARYIAARERIEAQTPSLAVEEVAEESVPAYPGGPLPGEEIDADLGG